MMCVVAATVYACGKTFLWPTMLGVASEQFPRGGAVTLGMIGGVGMLSQPVCWAVPELDLSAKTILRHKSCRKSLKSTNATPQKTRTRS